MLFELLDITADYIVTIVHIEKLFCRTSNKRFPGVRHPTKIKIASKGTRDLITCQMTKGRITELFRLGFSKT